MKNRRLGKHGQQISEVGLGCWQLGADWSKSDTIDAQGATAILSSAVDTGVTFFDTANVYGNGRSETFIGQFLQQCPQTIFVATKFGRGDEVYPGNYSEAALRRSVTESLKRLGVKSLDLLQLHCIPTAVLRDATIFDWLRALQKEGLIRHFGASVESVEEGHICLAQEGLHSLQIIFNIFRQKPVTELLPQAKAQGVGIIVRLPLASGLLSGKFTAATTFPETDHRHYNRDGQHFNVGETFAGLPFEKGVALVDSLKTHIPDGMTLAQMAMRWILDHEAVSTIIPGASSPDQARANAAVSDMAPLSEELHHILSEFYSDQVHDHIRGPY